MHTKVCNQCGEEKQITEFHSNGSTPNGKKKTKPNCKECLLKSVTQRHIERMSRLVDLKCVICGYDKFTGALEFHHKDPREKDTILAHMRTYSDGAIMRELSKCICVCANCHREIHGGLIELGL
jgi:hypothetical protein